MIKVYKRYSDWDKICLKDLIENEKGLFQNTNIKGLSLFLASFEGHTLLSSIKDNEERLQSALEHI